MAALTVALNLLKQLQPFLESKAEDDVGLLWNFKDDLREMEKTLVMLEAVLHDAASRSNQETSVQLWLAKLRDACHDLQDMLDHHMLPYREQPGQLGCVEPMKVCFGNLHSRIVLAHKMKSMRARLNKIAASKNKYALKEITALNMPKIDKKRETFCAPESKVLGRDKEQSDIVNMIINKKTSQQIFVIPIYGIGGIGKTTLAQSIFNDRRLRNSKHFDVWAWAYVSSIKFDLFNIGSRILSSLRNSEFVPHTLENIISKLKREVLGKRCLIVLDDIWSVDMDLWHKFINMLTDSLKGSTIVVTTRIENTAIDIASVIPYHLNTLSKINCILLFQKKAFKSTGEMKKYPKLEEIGKNIAKKCGGVALVANALGSMLCSQRDEKLWSYVQDSDIWELHNNNMLQLSTSTQNSRSQLEDRIFSGLQLSYNIMPVVLKPCFAYCSMYPKGHQIDPLKLIQHWVSLNFIRSDSSLHSSQTLHDIAQCYLNILISMSFLQKSQSFDNFGNDFIVMHDLMHDLAHHVAKDHDIKIVGDKENTQDANVTSYRYMSIYGLKKASELSEIVQVDGKVRAISLYSDKLKIKERSFSRARSLRVLEAKDHEIILSNKLKQLHCLSASHIPEEIILQNIQFLHLHPTSFSALPKSIGNFQKLQFLNLSLIHDLETIPDSIVNLHKLLHLDLSQCSQLKELPNSFGNLTSLQYLNLSRCSDLKTLPDSIVNLEKLLHLDLRKSSLKELPKNSGNLTSLQYLNLSSCNDLETLPHSIVNLYRLLHLDLSHCSQLKKLPKDFGNLKRLQYIDLSDCENLETLPDSIVNLQKLEHLYLRNCFKLEKLLQHFSNLTYLQLTSLRHLSLPFHTILSTSSMKLIRRLTKFESLKLNLDFTVKEEERDEKEVEEGIKEKHCCNIVCLENLNMLEGRLTLRGLEKVKDAKDATRANLKEKHKLESLELIWNGDDVAVAAAVLQNLQPSPELGKLIISGYGGRQWPSWMMDHHIRTLSLRNIQYDTSEQRHERVVSAKMARLKKSEFLHFALFPSLKYFCIEKMQNLEHVLLTDTGKDQEGSILHIKECPHLTRITLVPSVKILEIEGNVGLVLSPDAAIEEASSLEILHVYSCELVTLPGWIGELSSLKELHIDRCLDIRYLSNNRRQLTQLQELAISGCSVAFEQECKDPKYEIRSQIQHIPKVKITTELENYSIMW